MKANKKYLKQDTRAQVGIGTLIIFIAMVLVAAVAAAVLIQTSGILQQKAQQTGKQSTQEVSSNMMIKSIEGIRASGPGTDIAGNISLLKLSVGLNVGSSPVDVNQLVITITDGSSTNNLVYANNQKLYGKGMANFSAGATDKNTVQLLNDTQTTPGANAKYFFTVEKVRDEDGSFSQEKPVMNTGDLAVFYIATTASADIAHTKVGPFAVTGLKDSGLVIAPRTTMNLVLTPEAGATTVAEFVTPSSYGIKENIILYP